MRKSILPLVPLVLFIVSFSCSYGCAAEEDWYKSCSVKVLGTVADKYPNGFIDVKAQGMGSGTVVRVDKVGYDVVTCNHVAPRGVWVRVLREGSGWIEADDLRNWPERDLAFIHVPDKEAYKYLKAVIIAEREDFVEGTPVVKCGYPGGKRREVTVGTCSGLYSTKNIDTNWKSAIIKLRVNTGDSGGGLFRKKDRVMVGVVHTSSWEEDGWKQPISGTYRAHVTTVKDVREFLKRVR
jgi:S1-C subfamily serine protease